MSLDPWIIEQAEEEERRRREEDEARRSRIELPLTSPGPGGGGPRTPTREERPAREPGAPRVHIVPLSPEDDGAFGL